MHNQTLAPLVVCYLPPMLHITTRSAYVLMSYRLPPSFQTSASYLLRSSCCVSTRSALHLLALQEGYAV